MLQHPDASRGRFLRDIVWFRYALCLIVLPNIA
jgi:hypothetical protein